MRYPHVFLFAASMLWVLPAHADGTAEDEARALFTEGNGLVKSGDYESALQRFRSAYERFPSVKILLNIGTVLRQLGRDAEAANAYEAYLRDPDGDPAKKPEVEKLLGEIDGRVAKLRVDLSDPDMVVLVDGEVAEKRGTSVSMRVAPGKHTIIGEKGGVAVVTKRIEVGARKEEVLAFAASTPTAGNPKTPPAETKRSFSEGIRGAAPKSDADKVQPTSSSLSHRSQFGAIARADIDGQFRGMTAAFGVSYGVAAPVDVSVVALLGREKGAEIGTNVYILQGALKPMISVGVPTFFVEGVRPGARAGVGLMWDPSRHFGAFVQASGMFFPNAPEGYHKLIFVPSIGIQPRL
jgi:hypothetical protein